MDIIEDIKPLSAFKQKSADVIRHVKLTGRPTFITINGNVEIVLQDAASYQQMVNRIEELQNIVKIAKGLNDHKDGKTTDAKNGFSELKKKVFYK